MRWIVAGSDDSFWKTLPGVLTGVAAVIVAIAGLWTSHRDPSSTTAPALERPTLPVVQSGMEMPGPAPAGIDPDMQITVRKGATTGVLFGGMRLTLVKVTSLKGREPVGQLSAAEANARLPESSRLLGRLLAEAKVSATAADLLALPQSQWSAFLASLKKSKRELITRTPIAHLAVRVDGESVADRHLLEGDALDVSVRNRVVRLTVGAITNGRARDEAAVLLLHQQR